MNSVKAAFTNLDQQIMQISADQSKYHGANWKAGGANSDEQNENLYNIAQGNFKLKDGVGLGLNIGEDGLLYQTQDVNAFEDGKYIVSRKVPYSDLNFGSQYTGVLKNLVNQEMKEVGVNAETHKARGKNEFIESKARMDVEEHVENVLENDPNAVTNEFYQGKNPIINMYIAQKMKVDPNSEEFKKITKGPMTDTELSTYGDVVTEDGPELSRIGMESIIKEQKSLVSSSEYKKYKEMFNAYKSPEFAEELKQYYIDMQTQSLKNHYYNENPIAETTTTTKTGKYDN